MLSESMKVICRSAGQRDVGAVSSTAPSFLLYPLSGTRTAPVRIRPGHVAGPLLTSLSAKKENRASQSSDGSTRHHQPLGVTIRVAIGRRRRTLLNLLLPT